MRRKPRRRPCAAAGVEFAVKDLRRCGHGAGWLFCCWGGNLSPMKSQITGRVQEWRAEAGRRALDLAMPPHCLLSREKASANGLFGARACGAARFIETPYCQRCGAPFAADDGADVECPSCIADPPDFDRARAALVCDGAAHRMIVRFKHSDRTELAAIFGLWRARAGRALVTSSSLLAPIALHPKRLRTRRFNLSALLARSVAAELQTPLSIDGVARRRQTPPQKDLSAQARRRNVCGAFGIRNEAARARFKGAHVALIDDVLTTGATLSAAARALKRAGAAQADALVLARVVRGGIGAI